MKTHFSVVRLGEMLCCCLLLVAALSGQPSVVAAAPSDAGGAMLPAGYLSTRGCQIVDGKGTPVRIACVGGLGTVTVGERCDYSGPIDGLDANIAAIRKFGFNCVRVDFNDNNVSDPVLMSQFDDLVAACGKYGVKVIFDNHNNEATAADWGNAAQQTNGLWYDSGPGTDGTDGAGDKGTITNAQFLQDWVTMAKHWAGNPTVIGFDIRNEPCGHYKAHPPVWGGGGPTDILAMYENVGNAIQAVDPGALIICEAIINWQTGAYEGDLSVVKDHPIVLNNPAKLVYSLHEYPFPKVPSSGPVYIQRMNKLWGYLITDNIAPVWLGEMGSFLDQPFEQDWAKTLLDYMNGVAPGGIRFSKDQQPISGDWWRWGYRGGQKDGCIDQNGNMFPDQGAYIAQMLYRPDRSN